MMMSGAHFPAREPTNTLSYRPTNGVTSRQSAAPSRDGHEQPWLHLADFPLTRISELIFPGKPRGPELHKAEESSLISASRVIAQTDDILCSARLQVRPDRGVQNRNMAPPRDDMDKAEGQAFLESLLNKKLRIHTTDERMFWGEFKCTDPVGEPE